MLAGARAATKRSGLPRAPLSRPKRDSCGAPGTSRIPAASGGETPSGGKDPVGAKQRFPRH